MDAYHQMQHWRGNNVILVWVQDETLDPLRLFPKHKDFISKISDIGSCQQKSAGTYFHYAIYIFINDDGTLDMTSTPFTGMDEFQPFCHSSNHLRDNHAYVENLQLSF